MSKLTGYLMASRPWSFSMTAISVVLGSVMAAGTAPFSWPFFVLVLIGMILAHAATNLINDYFDTRAGVDTPEAPTARYREHPILTDRFTGKQILTAALVTYAGALAAGLVLAAFRGWVLLAPAAIGLLAGVFYAGRPVRFKHRAAGEIAVFLMWGPLMFLGAYYVQTRSWQGAGTVLLVSIPQGLWVALVLFANNLKDIGYDEKTGVRTAANLLGRRRSQAAYAVGLAAIYAIVAALAVLGVMPVWALLTLASVPVSANLALRLARAEEIPPDADPRTAQAGMVFGLLLVAGYLANLVVPL